MKTKRKKHYHRPIGKREFVTIAAYKSDHQELCGMITEEVRSVAQVIRQLIDREKKRLQYKMQNASGMPSAMQDAG